ncbi:unnamed protein product [Periconia digitata]|uniref:Uncharacterized protein n=1 Tax=Periconia digitata TaxID=1303443 RepID=A0A9W4U9I7_9PLEO|nr:unnamed protein product [Periconia digitata]
MTADCSTAVTQMPLSCQYACNFCRRRANLQYCTVHTYVPTYLTVSSIQSVLQDRGMQSGEKERSVGEASPASNLPSIHLSMIQTYTMYHACTIFFLPSHQTPSPTSSTPLFLASGARKDASDYRPIVLLSSLHGPTRKCHPPICSTARQTTMHLAAPCRSSTLACPIHTSLLCSTLQVGPYSLAPRPLPFAAKSSPSPTPPPSQSSITITSALTQSPPPPPNCKQCAHDLVTFFDFPPLLGSTAHAQP